MADDSPEPGTDDEFDRQLRALTEGLAGEARFHELSAAERAKAGARRAKEARKQAARSARLAERTARRATGLPSTRRRWLLGSLIIVVAVAIVSGLFWVSVGRALRGGSGGSGGSQPGRGSTTPTGTPSATSASATSTPGASSPPAAVGGPPPADPFANTQGENWADGAAGIVIPAAHPVGGYTAAQVADAYRTTGKLLIAAALDRQTLLGGAPTAFAGLLTRQQRSQFLAGLNRTGVDKQGNKLSTRTMVTSFAPGTAQLIGPVIKVHGTMSARAAVDQRQKVLAVDVVYRFVYPVEPPGAPTDWIRVISEISGSVEFGDWAQASTPFQPAPGTCQPATST